MSNYKRIGKHVFFFFLEPFIFREFISIDIVQRGGSVIYKRKVILKEY